MSDIFAFTAYAVSCAAWYLWGRGDGRRKAIKDLRAYVLFAAPIFRRLRTEEAEQVVIVVTRSGDDEWTATSQVTNADGAA